MAEEGRDHPPSAWWPAAFYLTVLTISWVVSWQVMRHLGVVQGSPVPRSVSDGSLHAGWVRHDAGWYVRIAEHGYSYTPGEQSTVAFFPSYPLSIRWLGALVGDVTLAGVLITVGSGLGTMVCFWHWCADRLDRASTVIAMLALGLFPYAFFLYGAMYGEAFFLFAVLASFLLLERERPVLAGLVAMVATAGRPVGVALIVGLVIVAMERRGALSGSRRFGMPRHLDLRRMERSDLGVLLSLVGISVWCGYLWVRFGDPLLFSSVQEAWGHPTSPATWFKADLFTEVASGENRRYANGLIFQTALTAVAVALVPRVHRRFGLGYSAYTVIVLVLPLLGNKDMHGMGRYVLPAFAVFAAGGEVLADRPVLARYLLIASGTALLVLTAGFARGYWLA